MTYPGARTLDGLAAEGCAICPFDRRWRRDQRNREVEHEPRPDRHVSDAFGTIAQALYKDIVCARRKERHHEPTVTWCGGGPGKPSRVVGDGEALRTSEAGHGTEQERRQASGAHPA